MADIINNSRGYYIVASLSKSINLKSSNPNMKLVKPETKSTKRFLISIYKWRTILFEP